MRDIIESEDNCDDSMVPDASSPDEMLNLFQDQASPPASAAQASTLLDYNPTPVQAFKLWQLFLDRVNPLTKIVHIPTLQQHIVTAATNAATLPLRIQALFLAIFTMGAFSMTGAEARESLGLSREDAISKLSASTSLVLRKTNFLRSFDMTTLQALMLYMVGGGCARLTDLNECRFFIAAPISLLPCLYCICFV